MPTCAYHCEDRWLPVKGTEDAICLEDDGEVYEFLPLLMPTQLTPCFSCNDLSFTNLDLNTDRSNELRLIDHWR